MYRLLDRQKWMVMILSDSKIYEKTLIMRLTQDDEEAFGEIYTRYKKRIYYFAFKFVKSKELAEDICHDVFVALWETGGRSIRSCRFLLSFLP